MRDFTKTRRPNARRTRRAASWRIAGAVLIAAVLAGCDRCGDWVSPVPGSMACRQDAPKPR